MEHPEVVGIGGEGVHDMELRLRSGGSTGRGSMPRARARSIRPLPAEDITEGALADGSDLADEIELVILQPHPHAGIELGQHIEWMGREKAPFVTRGDIQQLTAAFPLGLSGWPPVCRPP